MLRMLARTMLVFGGFIETRREARASPQPMAAEPAPTPPSPPAIALRPAAIPTLWEACRRYQEAALGWRLDRIDAEELARLKVAMGPELYAWVRVQVATGDRYTWRPTQDADPLDEKRCVAHEMRRDLALWERALVELDRAAATARRLRQDPPEPLDVPPDIGAALAARRAAAQERAKRRAAAGVRAGAGAGGEAPELAPPAPRGPRR